MLPVAQRKHTRYEDTHTVSLTHEIYSEKSYLQQLLFLSFPI